MSRSILSAGCLALFTLLPSCADDSAASATVLRFSGIPDLDKAKLNANAEVIEDYLSKELGIPVKFVESADYTAACNGVASNKLDLAWLGGVTAVQAEQRSKDNGGVTFVACRASDLEFKSYFIANKAAIDAGKIREVASLAEAKDMLKNCTFTFGSKSSTSGRVMPQHFMEEAGISIEDGVEGGARFQLSGGHTATLDAVRSGSVDVGVLNYTVYDAADDATKAQAVKIFTTPKYVDYCMVAHNRLGKERIAKIRAAFLKLDPSNPDHKKVLESFSANTFVAPKASDWDGIRAVLKTVKLD